MNSNQKIINIRDQKVTLDLLDSIKESVIVVNTNVSYDLAYLYPYYKVVRTGYLSTKANKYLIVLERITPSFTDYLVELLDGATKEELVEYFTGNFTKDAEEYGWKRSKNVSSKNNVLEEKEYLMKYENKRLSSVKVGNGKKIITFRF